MSEDSEIAFQGSFKSAEQSAARRVSYTLYWESFDVRRLLQITARCLFSISHFLAKKDVFVVRVGLFQQRFKDLLCAGQNTSPRMLLEWSSNMGY